MIVDGRITLERYVQIRDAVFAAGFQGDYEWSQCVGPPATPEDLAREYAYVVINSGMKAEIARGIFMRVWDAVISGGSAASVFGHKGKAQAIDTVWRVRRNVLDAFTQADDKIAMCETLPWIGKITKYHLAKNLGVDCAKPDRWLVRLAESSGETVDQLCTRLSAESGDRIATVDVVLWRACAVGIVHPMSKVDGVSMLVLDEDKLP